MNFTYEDVVREIRHLAAEYPQAIYQSEQDGEFTNCYYSRGTAGGGQGCIVGQALARLGYDVAKLDESTVYGAAFALAKILDCENEDWSHNFVWVSDVQNQQDRGKTWKEAVKYADALQVKRAINA